MRDPAVELDVSGKELDDAALVEIGEALTTVFKANSKDGVIIRIEELCLANNALTAQALTTLSQIIHLASPTLKDLDLSGNDISIDNEQDARSWERFLEAFQNCGSLRRLDLSGNRLGIRGLEIFVKIYTRQKSHLAQMGNGTLICNKEPPLDLKANGHGLTPAKRSKETDSEPGDKLTLSSLAEADVNAQCADSYLQNLSQNRPQTPYLTDQGAPTTLRVRGRPLGLRSVPYIIINDTQMNDTCALHLSYVVSEHGMPQGLLPLVPPAKAGPQSQQLVKYDQDSLCRGIMYHENISLGSDGWRVLELAEKARDEAIQIPEIHLRASNGPKTQQSNLTVSRPLILEAAGSRRRSSAISGSGEAVPSIARTHDLGAVRSKLQAEFLKRRPCEHELWRAALRVLKSSRTILVERRIQNGTHKTLDASKHEPFPLLEEQLPDDLQAFGGPRVSIRARTSSSPQTEPVISREASPQNGNGDFRRAPSNGSHHNHNASNGFSHKLSTNTVALLQRPYRSNTLAKGLNESIWGEILAKANDADNILSQRQQTRIVEWGHSRETLWNERAELGKSRANQIWAVLNGMGCLAYEPDDV